MGNLGFMEPFTLTQNPQPAALNPIGIGGWMAGVSFQRSYGADHGLAEINYPAMIYSDPHSKHFYYRPAGI
eukprot:COSAG01_NODE_4860_length_4677_cov_7.148100_2_plen_71_part_00